MFNSDLHQKKKYIYLLSCMGGSEVSDFIFKTINAF